MTMPRKRNRNRRKKRPSGNVPQVQDHVVRNPGSRRVKHRRVYQYETVMTLTDQAVNGFNPTLAQILGPSSSTTVRDWFDEFRIARFKLVATGVSYALKGVGVEGTPTITTCNNYEATEPTNRAELLRMKGTTTRALSFANGTILLAVVNKPTFDNSGSQNHYVTGWLSTGQDSALNTQWFGALMSISFLQQPGFSVALTVNCCATVDFRGFQ